MQPDTPTPEQAARQLLAARQEATEAATLAEQLADRVRDGDDTVTADQLGAQKQLAELAGLRVTAAERKLDAAKKADLEARARAVGDRARALVEEDSAEPITDAVQAVIASVRALATAAADRHTTIREVAAEGVRINDELGACKDEPFPSHAYGFRSGTGHPVGVIAIGVGRAEAVPAHRLLGIALAAALGDQGGIRQQVALELRGTREGFAHTASLIPGLTDALRDSEG